MFHIYALRSPEGEIRYIGKTVQNPVRRLCCHLYKARSKRGSGSCYHWIRQLQADGHLPTIEVLETCESENWKERERHWIAKLRGQLLNDTPGGNGAHRRTAFPNEHLHLLGKISDRRVGDFINMSREMVAYHRQKLGIQPSWDRTLTKQNHGCRGKLAKNRISMDEILLGKQPDTALAELFGCSRGAVKLRRLALGIAPFYINKITLTNLKRSTKVNL